MIALAEIGIVIVLVTSLFVVGCITIPHCLLTNANPLHICIINVRSI